MSLTNINLSDNQSPLENKSNRSDAQASDMESIHDDGVKSEKDSQTSKTLSGNSFNAKQLIGMSIKKTRKTNKKKDFIVQTRLEPAESKGIFIKHPDCDKMAPKDYLLIARVVKRRVRPLTVAEANQRQRAAVLQKLDEEIRNQTKLKTQNFERLVKDDWKMM